MCYLQKSRDPELKELNASEAIFSMYNGTDKTRQDNFITFAYTLMTDLAPQVANMPTWKEED